MGLLFCTVLLSLSITLRVGNTNHINFLYEIPLMITLSDSYRLFVGLLALLKFTFFFKVYLDNGAQVGVHGIRSF